VADHKVIRTEDLFYSPQEAQRGQENDDDRNKKENKFGQEANEGSSVGVSIIGAKNLLAYTRWRRQDGEAATARDVSY
jgi:hypothetical protein